MSDMTQLDFEYMIQQYFGRSLTQIEENTKMSTYPNVLIQFARQVYELGEANGAYSEKLKHQRAMNNPSRPSRMFIPVPVTRPHIHTPQCRH
jgi:hypothetical protein